MAETEQLDVTDLLRLARDKSIESRTRLVQIVGDLYFDRGLVLGKAERALMIEIMGRLIHDVEVEIRRTLAVRLAEEEQAPHELVRALANDEIEIARPILLKSPVLRDLDLIEIVHHRTMQHQLAIALRPTVSEPVSDALVETGSVDVIKTLLDNPNAAISEATKAYLVEESRRIDAYRKPLLDRKDLPRELAKRMYWWVSAALRQHIVENFDVDPTTIDRTIVDTIGDILGENEKLNADADAEPIRAAAALATRLKHAHAITPQLLIQTLRVGEVTLFEDLFAQLTGLRTQLIRRFIYEPGGEGLAIACKGVGIETADFAAIFLQSRGARPGDKIVDPDELGRTLRFFGRIKRSAAERMLKRWQLDPDYLFAIKRVSETAATPRPDGAGRAGSKG